jgi:elongation factor Ts
MEISIAKIKELREKTSAGYASCKKALQETQGDIDKAVDILRKKGEAVARKKQDRTTGEGIVSSYIHFGGKIGAMVELNCETDFVARTDEFKNLAKEIAMQIAATTPLYVSKEDVPQDVIEKEKEVYSELCKKEGKKEQVIEKIVEGRLKKFYSDVVLLEQPYIKDDKKTISSLVKEKIGILKENIVIKRFVRFQIGGD